jgi:hypothetical protein
MNPITWFNNWLDARPESTLWTIIVACGVGIYIVLLYLIISGSDSGFRIRRGRRWWS